MNGIAYVEINVWNLEETVEYFTDRWDLANVARAYQPGQRSALLRAGKIQLVLSAPDGPNSQVRDWLDQHGEGVVDVANYCEDTTSISVEAVGAGLPILRHGERIDHGYETATIGGLGTIRHTLVASDVPIAPPGFPWVVQRLFRRQAKTQPPISRLRAIDHIAVCLPRGTLQETADLYQTVFGLQEMSAEVIKVGTSGMDSRVLRDESGTITYVMAEPTPDSRGGQVEGFTAAHHGAGVQHLAFSTTDICAAVAAYADRGVSFCSTPDTYYDQLAERLPDHHREIAVQLEDLRRTGVLITNDHGGLLSQIFSTNPHDGELFYELIERGAGATGFGNDNVKALFAARAAAMAASELDIAG
jgi:4-hydroxymandelate synthase